MNISKVILTTSLLLIATQAAGAEKYRLYGDEVKLNGGLHARVMSYHDSEDSCEDALDDAVVKDGVELNCIRHDKWKEWTHGEIDDDDRIEYESDLYLFTGIAYTDKGKVVTDRALLPDSDRCGLRARKFKGSVVSNYGDVETYYACEEIDHVPYTSSVAVKVKINSYYKTYRHFVLVPEYDDCEDIEDTIADAYEDMYGDDNVTFTFSCSILKG